MTKYKFKFYHNVDPDPTKITVKVKRKGVNNTRYAAYEEVGDTSYSDVVVHDDGNGITVNGEFRFTYTELIQLHAILTAHMDEDYKTYMGKK